MYPPVIARLAHLIDTTPGWHTRFEAAIRSVKQYQLDMFAHLHTVRDVLDWLTALLSWIPIENPPGVIPAFGNMSTVDMVIITLHFFLNQPSLADLQSTILADWMVGYANAIGTFLDSTDSITPESLATFYANPDYHMDEYIQNPSGWKTFNQFFARHVKPGRRPIEYRTDDRAIVALADAVYKGSWPIHSDSTITAKGITWSISELLHGNPYASAFRGGTFIHAYLSPTDYHRLHVPMSGTVVWTEVVPGHVYMETTVVDEGLQCQRISSVDGVGFQFSQARGIVILNTPFGLVACLPIGMSLVSSVTITAEVGTTLQKGDEFAYFTFGGSDYVCLFDSRISVHLTATVGTHYLQGTCIGYLDAE